MRRAILILNAVAGGWTFVSGTGHFVAVLAKLLGETPFVWDFRAYGLLLLGVAIAAPGLWVLLATRGLHRGAPGARAQALAASLAVLVVTAPVLPLQPTVLPFLAAANAVVLAATGRRAWAASRAA